MSLEICVLFQMVTTVVGFEREVGGKHDTEFLSLTAKYTETKMYVVSLSHEIHRWVVVRVRLQGRADR
jgi:hypothetical protein